MSKEIIINKSDKQNDGIDVIRGLAVLSVILLHINIRIPFAQSSTGKLFSQQTLNILFKSGYYGVIIFFVISGFLITTTSINRWGNLHTISSTQFYRIRFARIAPCLIGLLIILGALDILGVKGFVINTTSLGQAIFSALTFHINWLEAKTGYLPGSWDVLWSLSVEETFYLFFPLLCLLARKELTLTLILLVFIVLGPFARCMFSSNEIWSDHSYLSCMDGIAMGCLAALLANKFQISKKYLLSFLLIGFSLFLFVFIFRKQAYDLGMSKIGLNVTVLEFSMALMLIVLHEWFVRQKHHGSRFTAVFRWYGRNSYEIYLMHMFLVTLIAQAFYTMQLSSSLIILYAVTLILCGALGYLIAKVYSEPLNRLLRKKQSIANKVNIFYERN